MIRRLALAVTFLTGVPLPVRGEASEDDLWASMGWYPLVGLALGAVGWGLYAGAHRLAPPLVAAALVVVLLELFTRALHLDGLMDTCDGYFSGAPRERSLEIMKDSRSGAMGVFGAIAVVVVKVAALGSLAAVDAAWPLLLGWTAARTLPALDVRFFPYARTQGTGAPFARGSGSWPAVAAVGSLVAIVAVAALFVALAAQFMVARRLGGLTGDVYGMGVELAEAIALVTASVLATQGWQG